MPTSYGRGLMPDTFIDFKKQRFRWAYGAMQILQGAMRARCSPRAARCHPGQRYHFVAGWLPWVADGCNLLFNIAALGWSAAMVLRAAADRSAADDVLGAAAVAVHLQAREAGAPVPRAGRREHPADLRGRDRRAWR